MLRWLSGLRAEHVRGNIYELQVTGFGPAYVGPYQELCKFTGPGTGVEVHHIVAKEHLSMVPTAYSESNAPSIAIDRTTHKALSARITSEQGGKNTGLGGRPKGYRASVQKHEILDLYRQVYTRDTRFRELYEIVTLVLR